MKFPSYDNAAHGVSLIHAAQLFLIEGIQKHPDGVTFDLCRGRVRRIRSDEYVASVRRHERTFLTKPNIACIVSWLSLAWDSLGRRGHYAGAWPRPVDAAQVVDVSVVFRSRRAALLFAELNGQDAVFCGRTGRCIPVRPTRRRRPAA